MGINFDGVSPEQKAKFEKNLADGIPAEEVKGLTEAEKQTLAKGLGGVKLPDTGEIKVSEPDVPKEKPGFLGKIWNGVKDFASTTTGKVVIDSAATVTTLALTAATFGLSTATLVGAVLLGATACTNYIKQDVAVYIDVSALLKALQDKEAADDKRHQDVMSALNTLIDQGNTILQIATQLKIQGAKLDTIIDLLVISGTNTNEMISILKSLGNTTDKIYEALGNVQIEQSQQTELLKTIVNNDNIEIEYLDTILNEIRNGNKLQANTQDILNVILDKLNTLDKNDKVGAEILNKILAKLVEFQQQDKDMDAKTHDLLQTIIENQGNYGKDVKQALSEILAKMDSMDKADQARFEYIVPILEGLGSKGAEILNAIKEGNAFTGSQLNIIIAELVELRKQTGEIGDETKTKLDEITNNQESLSDNLKQAIVEILAKMDSMDKADQARFEYIVPILEGLGSKGTEILNAIKKGNAFTSSQLNIIIAELCKLEKLTDKLGKDTLSKLNDIVTNQNSMSLEFKQAIVDILGKMDSMDKADQARFEYIVPLLEKLGSDGADILNAIKEGDKITQSQLQVIIKNQNLTATQLESLRKLIMENNNIAKGTQDAVKNMQIKLGEDHAKILKALENGNLQLNQVITLLNAIDVKETDQTVALNIIGTTLNAIYDKIKDVAGYSEEFKTLLLKILAKIPDGCKCQPTDLSAIIDLLNKLLDEVQKDPSDSTDSNPDDGKSDHEGILNDLDVYF